MWTAEFKYKFKWSYERRSDLSIKKLCITNYTINGETVPIILINLLLLCQ